MTDYGTIYNSGGFFSRKNREKWGRNGEESRNLSVKMAERGGFEPPEGYPSSVFKTDALNHSTISPHVSAFPAGQVMRSGHRNEDRQLVRTRRVHDRGGSVHAASNVAGVELGGRMPDREKKDFGVNKILEKRKKSRFGRKKRGNKPERYLKTGKRGDRIKTDNHQNNTPRVSRFIRADGFSADGQTRQCRESSAWLPEGNYRKSYQLEFAQVRKAAENQ